MTQLKNKFIVLKFNRLSTSDYSAREGYQASEVQRKRAFIELNDAEIKKAEEFGLTIYSNAKSKKDDEKLVKFLIVPFAGTSRFFYEDTKQLQPVQLTKSVPNFEIVGGQVAISEGEKAGNTFHRVSAAKFVTSVMNTFEVDYFGDKNDYAEIQPANEKGLLSDENSSLPSDDLPF